MTMGEMIELTAACSHKLQAYRAGDAKATRGLVVVQEIFGVNGHMRRVCEELAGYGYQTVSPALFDRVERGVELGYSDEDIQRGLKLREKISEEEIVRDIEAAAATLAPRPTGIIGYCWGGKVAWLGATKSKAFKAAVGWYGGGIAASKEAEPACPVQLHFGAEDKAIPLDDVEAIRKSHPDMPVYVYEGAGHGFGCEERSSYNPRATEIALHRSLAFFAEHLV